MHQIVILGAGKSSSVLIEYLLENAIEHDLFIHIADVNEALVFQKTKGHPRSKVHGITNGTQEEFADIIQSGDMVISMLPPTLHTRVARICLDLGKHFLNASYLTDEIQELDHEVQKKGLTFLLEMGLDPGIDHMSAMDLIANIQHQNGNIISFFSHCGGLISPESDNNPWHYKISWNPKNVVLSGKDGAHFLENGVPKFVPYHELFDPEKMVAVPGDGTFSWYPNRNSLPYLDIYGLKNINHFVRTTLRHPDFIAAWKFLVKWKMTSEEGLFEKPVAHSNDFFHRHISKFGHPEDLSDPLIKKMMEYLGMNEAIAIPSNLEKPFEILQYLLETKLFLEDHDMDMIVMLHELIYEINGIKKTKKTSLIIKGEDHIRTAMAKTVGLPLALAAIQILEGKIKRKGVFIPIYQDIYVPILHSLKENGIVFEEIEF